MTLDLAVIGAGPAGVAAATEAASLGLAVALYDEQAAPGGQIYRAIETTPARRVLGRDYGRGEALAAAFRQSSARYVPNATVWSLEPGCTLGVSVAGRSEMVEARQTVVATGALERPMPIPGWTLPGVMTAGAAQILLKSSGVLPKGRIVLAGTGPLIWLVAWQLLRAGVRIEALLDTTPDENWRGALGDFPAFAATGLFWKGLGLMAAVRRRVPVVSGVEELRAVGGERLRAVAFKRPLYPEETIAADVLLLHQGVVPNVNLAMAAGVDHAWNDARLCFEPTLDEWLGSSADGIAVAGDGGGIGGALAAEERGRLAALGAAYRLGRIDAGERDRRAAPVRARLARAMRGRHFLDAFYRPADKFRIPTGDTIVCRCEEIRADQLAEAIALGAQGPNQAKAFLRAGMGPCQGRFCALTVAETIAAARGVSPGEIGHQRIRPPVKPVTLGELAALPTDEADSRAVDL